MKNSNYNLNLYLLFVSFVFVFVTVEVYILVFNPNVNVWIFFLPSAAMSYLMHRIGATDNVFEILNSWNDERITEVEKYVCIIQIMITLHLILFLFSYYVIGVYRVRIFDLLLLMILNGYYLINGKD